MEFASPPASFGLSDSDRKASSFAPVAYRPATTTSTPERSNIPSEPTKNLPNGTTEVPSAPEGPATSSMSTHATPRTPAAAGNVWAARSQKQQRPQAAFGDLQKTTTAANGSLSGSMSRSPSRKSRSVASEVPQLDDVSEWPDVRETLHQAPMTRVEKDAVSEKPTGGSSGQQKKEKKKWVQMPPSELQEALDANRSAPTRNTRVSKTQPSSRSHSSPSHSLAQSRRTSPHSASHPRHPRPDHPPQVNTNQSLPQSSSAPIQRAPSHTTAPPPPPQSHPLPERPTMATMAAPNHPHPRRPAPSKSLPVGGWFPVNAQGSPRTKPLFGMFTDRLPVNATPQMGVIARELDAVPMSSPPSPSQFGPDGPFERVTKQRGRVAIPAGYEGQNGTAAGEASSADDRDAQVSLGSSQDGWFVVDGERAASNSLQLDPRQPSSRVEFGRFDAPTPTPPSHSRHGSYVPNGMAPPNRRVPGAESMRGPREGSGRRGSFSENMNGNVNPAYRSASQPYGQTPRRGGMNRNNGALRNQNRATSAYGNANGGPRSMNGTSYRQQMPSSMQMHAQPMRGGYAPNPYDPASDPYGGGAYGMGGATDYSGYYANPAMGGGMYGGYPPYGAPYGGYGMPPFSPNGFQSPNGAPYGANSVHPIPMPVTPSAYQLDPQRYWLLGQIEYYFSLQNLDRDIHLRRNMDSEGWIEIKTIANFNRIKNITPSEDLVRDTMMLSDFLEVSGSKVRLSERRWQDYVLPITPGSSQAGLPSTPSSAFPAAEPTMMSAAAYSLATSLSGLTVTNDDAATIQAKVTEAVLNQGSVLRRIAEEQQEPYTPGGGDGSATSGERDESASTATAPTHPTTAATSPPSSPGASEREYKPLAV